MIDVQRPRESGFHLLLVEDSDGDAHLVQHHLRRHARIDRVHSLSEAIDWLASSECDALLLDLNLPDSHGLETLRALRTQSLELPIVVLTGGGDDAIGLEAVRLGADDFLDKDDLRKNLLDRALHYAVERRRLACRVRQSQRLEAIGQLAGGIAHDFNNMLMVIDQSAEQAQSRLQDPQAVALRLEQIRTAAQRSAGLTRQILAFARQQKLQISEVAVREVLTETQGLLRHLLGAHVRLDVQHAPGSPHILVDPNQIQQVLVNLALNARDAMPDGGELSITSSVVEYETQPIDHELLPGRYALLCVRDTGPGLEPDVLPRVFEPFFTTKRGTNATGLGLAVVHGAVKQNGGHVAVESELGRGTTFRVHFPLAASEAASAPPRPAAAPTSAPDAPGTVLLAEDEELIRDLIATALRDMGLAVLSAASGEEALELAAGHPHAIDLLVSDVVMPGISGGELAERLVAARPDLSVLLLSGYAGPILARRTPLAVPHSFLAKPVSTARLKHVVREILEERRLA